MNAGKSATLLEVADLRTYLRQGSNTVKAVDGVSFSLDAGETLCLVGESGSGKSMTALSIMRLTPRDVSFHPSGSVGFVRKRSDGTSERVDTLRLNATEMRTLRGSRMAMIFQEPMTSLNPVFTIGEQIIEALLLHKPGMSVSEARARAIDALTQVRIPEPESRVDEYPHRLSGGQRQRVMIAMAMACEPDLLIADEPTTALDVTVQAEILRLMREMQERRGTAILFITHDFGVVASIAHRVAVMRSGRIVEAGRVREVLSAPQHDYTRQLLAALPENLKRHRPRTLTENLEERSKRKVLLSVEDVQIHFPVRKGFLKRTAGFVKAVDGVSLQLREGLITALVGESGCGKTTLGRAILRLIDPTAGRVTFDGADITQLPKSRLRPYRKSMQIIFQDPVSSLNPRLKVVTTLTEPLAVHGIGASRDERIELARKTLHDVQLKPDHLWLYPHEFSGGQRQRIGIARALALSPRFIVCDEITSSLDVSIQAEILQMLLQLRRDRQLTLLLITHDIGVVEYIADVTAVMHQGKIVEIGPTEQICGDPKHPYTQRLLSAVPRVGSIRFA
jgi:peptide/nickel transport system ATP-binding protein